MARMSKEKVCNYNMSLKQSQVTILADIIKNNGYRKNEKTKTKIAFSTFMMPQALDNRFYIHWFHDAFCRQEN